MITGSALYLKKNIHFRCAWETWFDADWTDRVTEARFILCLASAVCHSTQKSLRKLQCRFHCFFVNPGGDVWMVALKHVAIYFGHTFQSSYTCTKNNATVQLISMWSVTMHLHDVRCEARWKRFYLNKALTRLSRNAPLLIRIYERIPFDNYYPLRSGLQKRKLNDNIPF